MLIGTGAVGALGVFGCARMAAGRLSAAERGGEETSTLSAPPMPRLAFGGFTAAETPVEKLLPEGDRPLAMNGLCPPDMASVDDRFCVDRYEASLVEVRSNGQEEAYPYYLPVEGHVVRAVSQKGVYPQGYISGVQAASACRASGKRLCKPTEWRTACKGPERQKFGYGNEQVRGTCNDNGRSPMGLFYGRDISEGTAWVFGKMNDSRLNQTPGTLAETGSHDGCTNGYGVYDMVGNLHEWVDDQSGTFQGGYYLDVTQNGDGCGYRTDAHEFAYHDYSTGFRCCADVAQ
ncbi:MAG TPA: SUMF1/EgtB/PvdO family nonheme iron enzyme [Labilithrix sp.]